MSDKAFNLICKQCQFPFTHADKRKFYCSKKCERKRSGERKHLPRKSERTCKSCGNIFKLKVKGDNNRKYCSERCAKRYHNKQQATWRFDHPGHMKIFNANRIKKHPTTWTDKNNLGRHQSIELLGGVCAVSGCGVTKRVWLHVDFIPTTVGMPYRHPRHFAFIKRHPHLFRLLCANHHYELTLTGKIDGTDITQPRHIPKRR